MADPLAQAQQVLRRRMFAAAEFLASECRRDLLKTDAPADKPGRSSRAGEVAPRSTVVVVPVPGGFRVVQSSAVTGEQPALAIAASRVAGRLARIVRDG